MTDGSNNTLSSMTGRDVNDKKMVAKIVNLSLWVPFTLNHTFLFQECAKLMEQNLLFDNGNYCGKNEKNDSTPMNFIWMKSWDEDFHRVDNIRDFAVINPKYCTLLDTRHIAHLLLEFKEDRLVASQEVLLIKNTVEYWARD